MARERVTVVEIAHAAGVSKSTVSLVLQGSSRVNAATRDRVNAVIRELGYVYNRGAANLRQANAKSKIIGVVVNDLTNGFFAELAVGVDDVVQSAGYVQFLANTGESVDRQRQVIASMREHGMSGLVISPARGTEAAELKPLTASGLPVVVTVRDVPGAKVSTLMSENRAGARAAAEHLVKLGHRRIAYLGGICRHCRVRGAAGRASRRAHGRGPRASGRAGVPVGAIAGRGRRRHRPRHAGGESADGGALPQRCRRLRCLRRPESAADGARPRLRGGRFRRRHRGEDGGPGADHGVRRSAGDGPAGAPSCS